MVSSLPKLARSSSRSTIEGCRKMKPLIVSTGEAAPSETYDFRAELLLLARDEDGEDNDRRNEVRRLCGERREVMV